MKQKKKISAAADFTAHDADDMLSACKAQAVCQYCDNQPDREGQLDKNGTATGSVPIVINVDHTKYKTN